MMHNYDIKFLNKEITPFGGLSLLQVPKRSAIKECPSLGEEKETTSNTNKKRSPKSPQD